MRSAKQAETCAEFLSKGRTTLVEGRLSQRSWETPEGQKRSKHEVVAERVQFIGGRKGPEEEPPSVPGEEPPF
jgi:single-strand DNA-binding protein